LLADPQQDVPMNPTFALKRISLADLRPTQATVGRRQVNQKRASWKALDKKAQAKFLRRHLIPTVIGPKHHPYAIDNHHQALALHEEGAKTVLTTVVADLSALAKPSFWRYLDNRAWCHPYDEHGERQAFTIIPKTLSGMADDPFRGLAGELREKGGYAKDLTPFEEFLWADFLRGRIARRLVANDFAAALAKARKLAKSQGAAFLPGWCGRSD
jgi:hypothetical protein